MNFEYFSVVTINADLEIDAIGNCYIEAFNDFGNKHILWIKTNNGYTRILETSWVQDIPPLTLDGRPVSVTTKVTVMEYSESKVSKVIKSFLNNPSYQITQAFDKAQEYTEEEKLENLYNFINYMKG